MTDAPENATVVMGRESFFRRGAASTLLNEDPIKEGGFAPGKGIGEFRLVRCLGRGGMGEVWEAEQASLGRHVALKLLPPERVSGKSVEFFSREARAGGRIQHAGIVAVYGAGRDEGVHWISMELVEGGATLAGFVEQMRSETELPVDYYQRVAALTASVADALQVAHAEGVIHRDLKPLNILITPGDEPKVGDFGLARVVDEHSLSQTGDFAGTYYYMSPEQVLAKRMGIDQRTDVFSLGVVLYELLALQRPFEGDTTHQIAQKIVMEDPPDIRTLRSRVPEELVVICGKALEKRPEARYQSMAELAADVHRHLANEPILAKPPTTVQRVAKWTRRNPTKSVAGVVVAMAFVAIAGFWGRAEKAKADTEVALERIESEKEATAAALATARTERERAQAAKKEAARERDEAAQRADELQHVSDFQAKQLAGVDAQLMGLTIRSMVLDQVWVAGERAGRLPEVLEEERTALEGLLAGADFTRLALSVLDKEVFERALRELEEFGSQPLVQAQLLQALGSTMQEMGLLDRALEPQLQSVEIRRRELGDEHRYTLISINSLLELLIARGELAEAETLYHESLEIARQALGDEHPLTLASMNNLGLLRQEQGRLEEAEFPFREVLEARRRTLREDHPYTLHSLNSLGLLLQAQGEFDEAEALYREALEIGRQTLDDEGRQTLDDEGLQTLASMNNMGLLFCARGEFGEAEALYREVLAVRRRTLGNEHPWTLRSLNNLGILLQRRGKWADAEGLLHEALEVCRDSLGDEHPDTLRSINSLGSLFKDQGRLAEAELLFREALEGRVRTLGNKHPRSLTSMSNLGLLLQEQGRLAEADSLLREVLELRREILGDEHPDTLIAINGLGVLLRSQGKLVEAEPLSREALEVRRRTLGEEHPHTLNAANNLAELLQSQGKFPQAEGLFREVLDTRSRTLGKEHPSTLTSINNLGYVLQGQGRWDEAEPFFRDALDARRRRLDDDHAHTVLSISNLGLLRVDQGDLTEAELLFREALEIRRRTLGDGHNQTQVSRYNVIQLLGARGEWAEVEILAREFVSLAPTTDPNRAYFEAMLDSIAKARAEVEDN